MIAENVDIEVDQAYRYGGVPWLNYSLNTSDTLEHGLSRIGAQIAYLRTGDNRMYAELTTSKPPGDSDVLPDWALAAARDQSKALFQQHQRAAGKGGGENHKQQPNLVPPKEGDDGKGAARRRKRPQKKGGDPPAKKEGGS